MIAAALWDLVSLRRRADKENKRLATLAIEANLRFANPKARKDFSRELINAIEDVVAKHHDPDAETGRNFRLVMGAYPAPGNESSRTEH